MEIFIRLLEGEGDQGRGWTSCREVPLIRYSPSVFYSHKKPFSQSGPWTPGEETELKSSPNQTLERGAASCILISSLSYQVFAKPCYVKALQRPSLASDLPRSKIKELCSGTGRAHQKVTSFPGSSASWQIVLQPGEPVPGGAGTLQVCSSLTPIPPAPNKDSDGKPELWKDPRYTWVRITFVNDSEKARD